MARQGIFNRNDTTPEPIPRSPQYPNRRNSFTAQYMEIIPNFAQVMQPNESIKFNVTNFVKTIPMVTPMLSRVRLVQRFYAIPFRIMWRAWEDWIKGTNDASFLYEIPRLVNQTYIQGSSQDETHNGICTKDGSSIYDEPFSRKIQLDSNGRVPDELGKYCSVDRSGSRHSSLVCGVGELGDYFRYPIYSKMGIFGLNDEDYYFNPHAFYACAYQLAYSYGYRKPNVQTRVDDFYQMSRNQRFFTSNPDTSDKTTYQCDEFPNLVACFDVSNNKGVPVPTSHRLVTITKQDGSALTDLAKSSNKEDIIRTSWDKVETFPLKSGPNLSMLATDVDANGLPVFKPSNISLYRIRYANYFDDYFTSSNPWQQRGEEAQIPVEGSVSVDLSGLSLSLSSSFTGVEGTGYITKVEFYDSEDDSPSWKSSDLYSATVESSAMYDSNEFRSLGRFTAGSYGPVIMSSNDSARLPFSYTPQGNVSTTGSISGASGSLNGVYVSPSAFRFAMCLQHIKELEAQTDNRYKSYMRKIFGASIQDNRIDRPEFLGGSVQEINVGEVVQTSATADDSPLGTLAGKGYGSKTSGIIRFYAHEHTVIIGMLHIIPDTLYINGLDKEDNAHDRFDFPLPQFSRLSEQPVKNYELCYNLDEYQSSSLINLEAVFGYEPVYNELRWSRSMALGDFRDFMNSKGNYEYYKPWLITRDFGWEFKVRTHGVFVVPKLPTLSDEFLSGRNNGDYSNFAVNNPIRMKPFIVDSYFDVRMTRIIPARGLPAKLG